MTEPMYMSRATIAQIRRAIPLFDEDDDRRISGAEIGYVDDLPNYPRDAREVVAHVFRNHTDTMIRGVQYSAGPNSSISVDTALREFAEFVSRCDRDRDGQISRAEADYDSMKRIGSEFTCQMPLVRDNASCQRFNALRDRFER